MASYHFAYKHASRAQGHSAQLHADYIGREGRYGKGLYREQFLHAEHHNMPAWARDHPRAFWEAADTYERANGRLYTEMELALPRELDQDQQTALVRAFVAEHIGERHPVSWAMHTTHALDGGDNPHVHIMFSERTLDGIERAPNVFFKRANTQHPERGGAMKTRAWQHKATLLELRQAWAETANRALVREGHEPTLDHRSLAAQGITDREPEPHLGREQTAMLRRGEPSELGAKVIELRAYRERLREVEREIGETRGEIIDLQRVREAREREQEQQKEREVVPERTPSIIEQPRETHAARAELEGKFEALQKRVAARRSQPSEPVVEKSELDRKLDELNTRRDGRPAQVRDATPGQSDLDRRLENMNARREARLEAARIELELETGRPHQFASEAQVRGRLIDRVELAGTSFARIENDKGYMLVRWQTDMSAHQGREVTIELEGGRDVARALSILSREEKQIIRPGPKPDLERDWPQERTRGPALDLGI
jgi:hypothetical protein